MTNASKQTLRQTNQKIRRKLPRAYQHTTSARVCARILALDQFHKATRVAFYRAVNGEIDLSRVWQSATLQNKDCYFPVTNDNLTLSFLPTTPETPFCKGRFGLLEPDVDRTLALAPEQLDIIFMPLTAFDEHGTRIGMGGGYYDRTLAEHRPPFLIGVAYAFQRQPFIQAEAWDIPLTAVITQSATYWSKP